MLLSLHERQRIGCLGTVVHTLPRVATSNDPLLLRQRSDPKIRPDGSRQGCRSEGGSISRSRWPESVKTGVNGASMVYDDLLSSSPRVLPVRLSKSIELRVHHTVLCVVQAGPLGKVQILSLNNTTMGRRSFSQLLCSTWRRELADVQAHGRSTTHLPTHLNDRLTAHRHSNASKQPRAFSYGGKLSKMPRYYCRGHLPTLCPRASSLLSSSPPFRFSFILQVAEQISDTENRRSRCVTS